MKKFQQVVFVADAQQYQDWCVLGPSAAKEGKVEAEFNALFEDGYVAAIQVVSGRLGEPCWSQGVLFDGDGHEVSSTEVSDEFLGEYVLYDEDCGSQYTVLVKQFGGEAMTIENQERTLDKRFERDGVKYLIKATVKHDDRCKNGHNTFSITGELYGSDRSDSFGCIHEEIAEHFPELRHLLKWHGCTTDGPLHYIANTVYRAGDRDHWGKAGEKERDLDAARRSAIWPDATDEQLCSSKEELTALLEARLPALLKEFRRDVEAFGFTYEGGER